MKLEQHLLLQLTATALCMLVRGKKTASVSLPQRENTYCQLVQVEVIKEGEFNKIWGIHVDQNDLIYMYVSDHKIIEYR